MKVKKEEMKKEVNLSKKNKELEMRLWFAENELYSDGSNVYRWLPLLKNKLEEVFGIKLEKDQEKPNVKSK